MAGIVQVDPFQAANLLVGTNSKLKSYIQTIEEIAQALIAIGSTTFANPMAAAMLALGKALTSAGHAVNESVTSYGNSYADVVNNWKKTDMNNAPTLSFDKPPFGGVFFQPGLDDHVSLSPSNVRNLLDQTQSGTNRMNAHFNGIQDDMMRAPNVVGNGDWLTKTIDAFNRHVVPVNEQASGLLRQVHGHMESELSSFISRDNNYKVE